ncbi:MAG: transglycosylase SLT domain-containing protein [Longimicrobiales bacterium]
MHEVERVLRSLRALPLAAPLLLLVGFGAGELAKVALRIPDDGAARETTEKTVPRVHLDALSNRMTAMRDDGKLTVDYVTMYRDHVEPVERALRRRGVSRSAARKISWPLVQESQRKGLDPATVAAILIVESGGKATARSSVGARGLMQVMPGWIGHWKRDGCGRDLYDIKDNLCNGTSILAWYLEQHGTERKALLGYNGCVRGTNTPRCFTYPEKVWRLREEIRQEISQQRVRAADDADE